MEEGCIATKAMQSYSMYLSLSPHRSLAQFHPVQVTNERRICPKKVGDICTNEKVIFQHARPPRDGGLLATEGFHEAETLHEGTTRY